MKPISRRHVLGGLAKARKSLENDSRAPPRGSNARPATALDRRGYVKYTAAGVVAVAAGMAGCYLKQKSAQILAPTPTQTPSQTPTETVTPKVNHPPILSDIKVWPKYIKPTPEYTMRFSHDSYDLDGDPLTTRWVLDGREVSREPEYATKLSEGVHTVEMHLSDGLEESFITRLVEVEPDQIYPTKPLNVNYKGMRMTVGWKGMPRTPMEFTEEKLDVIRYELGCNAVIIYGYKTFEDDLIEAGRLAIEKRFDRVYVAPMYLDFSIEETVENIGRFARKVRTLREISDSVVYMVGHEFLLDSSSFVPGATYEERELNAWKGRTDFWKAISVLPKAFEKIISLCEKNYGYQITYAAVPVIEVNLVPWSHPIFESVGVDAYIWNKVGWTKRWVMDLLNRLKKKFKKPVNSTEWGTQTYKNASENWQVPAGLAKYPYDEDEQANYIRKYCEMLDEVKINGAFYTQIDDERPKGYGLYLRGVGTAKRKKGFYMYKSYAVKR